MTKEQKSLSQKYIKKVNKCFPAFYPNKRKVLHELQDNLQTYFSEHITTTSESELYSDFGTPDEYADMIISYTSQDELRNTIKMRARTILISSAIVVFILTVSTVGVFELRKYSLNLATKHVEEIIEISADTLTK